MLDVLKLCILTLNMKKSKKSHTNLYDVKFDQKSLCHAVEISLNFSIRFEKMEWYKNFFSKKWNEIEISFYIIRMKWKKIPISFHFLGGI